MITVLQITAESEEIFNIIPLLEIVEIWKNDYNDDKANEQKLKVNNFKSDYASNDSETYYYDIYTKQFIIHMNKNIINMSMKENEKIKPKYFQKLLDSITNNISITLDGDNDLNYKLLNKIINKFPKNLTIYINIYKTKNKTYDEYEYLNINFNHMLHNSNEFKLYTLQKNTKIDKNILLNFQNFPFIHIGVIESSLDIYDAFEVYDENKQIINGFELNELDYLQ